MGCLSAALVLTACSALRDPPQVAALLNQTPADLPAHVELTDVPFFAQTPYHCGPAALAMALASQGLAADPETLADAVFLPARSGSLQLEMLGGARRYGALAVRVPGELNALLREVRDGHPVIVLQNLALDLAPMWHYAVVVGYDLQRMELVLRSGQSARLVMPIATFERTWARAQHWAMVALAPGKLPTSVDEARAFESALAFERVARPDEARRVYQSLVARWPDHELAALGLGNAQRRAGDLMAAERTFEALALRRDATTAWINLAWVRLEQQRRPEAVLAAQRAVQRATTHEPHWLAKAHEVLAQSLAMPGQR